MHRTRLSPYHSPSYSDNETELEDEEMNLWGDSGWETEDEVEDCGFREAEEGGEDARGMGRAREEGRATGNGERAEILEEEAGDEEAERNEEDEEEEYWTPTQRIEGEERYSKPECHHSGPERQEPCSNTLSSFLTDFEEHSETDLDASPNSSRDIPDLADIGFFVRELGKRRIDGMKNITFVLNATDKGGEGRDVGRKDSKEVQVPMSSFGHNRAVRFEEPEKQSTAPVRLSADAVEMPVSKTSPRLERHFPLRGGIKTVPKADSPDDITGPADLYFRVEISDFEDSSVEPENEDNEIPQEQKTDRKETFSNFVSAVKGGPVRAQTSSSKVDLPMHLSEIENREGKFVKLFSNLTPLEHMILDMAPCLGMSAKELAAEMFDDEDGDEGRRYSWPADCWVRTQISRETSTRVVESQVKATERTLGERMDVKPVLRRKKERRKSEDLREAFSAQEMGRNDTRKILEQSRKENGTNTHFESSSVVSRGKDSSHKENHGSEESHRQRRSTIPNIQQRCAERAKVQETNAKIDENKWTPLPRRPRPHTQEYRDNRRHGRFFDGEHPSETRRKSNSCPHTTEGIIKGRASIRLLPSHGSLGRNTPTPEPIPIPIYLTTHDEDICRTKQRINTIFDFSQREIESRAPTRIAPSHGSPRRLSLTLEQARIPINMVTRSPIVRSSSPVLDNKQLPSIIKITDPAIPSNLPCIINITDPPSRTQTPYPYQKTKRPQDSYSEGLRLQSSRHHAWTIRQRAMALERAVSRQSRPNSREAMRYATIRTVNGNGSWKGKTEAMKGYWRSQVLLLNKLEARRKRAPLRLSCPKKSSFSNSSFIPVSSPGLPRTETPMLKRGCRTILQLIPLIPSKLSSKWFERKKTRRVLLKRPRGLETERLRSRNWFTENNPQLERVLFRGHEDVESRPRSPLRVTYGE